MKLAAICDFPYWESMLGTAVRFESICRSLTKVCDLTVICTAPLSENFKSFKAKADYRLIDGTELQEMQDVIRIPGVRPDRQHMVSALTHYCHSNSIDAVLTPYFNREWLTQYLSPAIVRIVDTIDCQSQRNRSFAKHRLMSTFPITAEEEAELLSRYDLALVISDEDYQEFSLMIDKPLIVAPFRLPIQPIYSARENGNDVVFVAAKSEINDLTLDYLTGQILPLVPFPLTLHVVGNVTLPKSISSNTRIVSHIAVEDIRWVYRDTDLALNPTYAGGGVKTKTLEAMSYGVPILTSDEGARGLRHLLDNKMIINDKERFAYQISTLLQNSLERLQLSQNMIERMRSEDNGNWLSAFNHIVGALRVQKLERYA